MIVYLMRHADALGIAEAHVLQDSERPLSDKGHAQAAQMAELLKKRGAFLEKIFVSPTRRTRETAIPFEKFFGLKMEDREELKSSTSAETIVAFLEQQKPFKKILVIGHEPALGETLAHLTHRPYCPPRPKASIACVDSKGVLRWSLSPEDALARP